MARIRFKGLEEYELKLSRISSRQVSDEIAGRAIYAGAGVIADAVRAEIEALPTVDSRKRGTTDNPIDGVTTLQKKGLSDGWGVAPMRREDGVYNTKLGFDGYNGVKTKKYPGGQPNQLIARSVNSGTSFRRKNPFVDRTVKSKKAAAEKAMAEEFDKALRENWEGK